MPLRRALRYAEALLLASALAGCAGDVRGTLVPVPASAPGTNKVTVEFNNAAGVADARLTKTLTVNVPADRDKLVFVSDTSTTPQTQ